VSGQLLKAVPTLVPAGSSKGEKVKVKKWELRDVRTEEWQKRATREKVMTG
jgi:hypothetical protein